MPTIIDSFVVEFGLDPAKFTEGQKKVIEALDTTKKNTERVAKEIEEAGKNAARFFTQLRNQAIEFFALFTAGKGIKEFVSDFMTGGAAVARFSHQLGLSANTLSAWQQIAERTGGTASGMTNVMTGLTSQIQQYSLTGESGQAIAYFRSLGINLGDAAHGFKTADQLLLELSDHVKGMDPRRAAEILRGLGADPGTIELLLRGGDALRRLLEEQKKFAWTDQEKDAAGRLLNAWNLLMQASEKLGRIIMTQVEPFITTMLQGLKDIAAWAQEHPALLDAAFAGAAVMISTLTFSLGVGLVGALGKVGIALTGISGPLIIAGAQIAAIVAGIAYLNEHAKTTKPGPVGRWLDEHLPFLGPSAPSWLGGDTPGGASGGRGGALDKPASVDRSMTRSQTRDYIRAAAIARGIDPEIALTIARSEGGFGFRVGDDKSSFGPFQLHYGGIASGGNAGPGLGEEFTKQTGLHPTDQNVREQIDFALDQARKGGWGPWHGWHGAPFAGIGAPGAVAGGGGPTSVTNTTHIDKVIVQTQATDADGIARSIGPALERSSLASQANYGNN